MFTIHNPLRIQGITFFVVLILTDVQPMPTGDMHGTSFWLESTIHGDERVEQNIMSKNEIL